MPLTAEIKRMRLGTAKTAPGRLPKQYMGPWPSTVLNKYFFNFHLILLA
jgi:hypothetical protein